MEGIRAPVFLAHGTDDQRVHVKHSREMAEALREAGKEMDTWNSNVMHQGLYRFGLPRSG